MSHYEVICCNTLGVASVIPYGIFVAPMREYLFYIRCSMILEGCNETLQMVLLNSTGRSSVTLLVIDSAIPKKDVGTPHF